jgi:hypothetical protein
MWTNAVIYNNNVYFKSLSYTNVLIKLEIPYEETESIIKINITCFGNTSL